ncbi:MAG TPA: LptF/LptG family permease [Cytophagaceae bacterium]|jgi:lipopolysaccharide export system permease protein|nr:LptF/LptG family permease [Cytophagaceae bacterium]
MLKKLDVYIIKTFLTTYAFVVALLIAILVVVDITEHLDDFIKSGLSPYAIMTQFYFNFIPYLINLLSPITIFIATIFVTANMAARVEIIAILCSGVSFIRFLKPFVLGASVIGLISFYMVGWLIPVANKARVDFENKYIKENYYFGGRNVHLKTSQDTYVFLESYNNHTKVGYQFTLEKIDSNDMSYKLKAPRIEWKENKKQWFVESYSERSFPVNGKETYKQGFNRYLTLDMRPDDFESTYLLYETFTMGELSDYIDKLTLRGSEDVGIYIAEKYQRYTYPFAVVLLTLMGVFISARKSREGPGLKIALGFALAFVYIIFVITSRSMANVGSIGPLFAAWLPNTVFGCVAFWLYLKVPK